MKNILLFGAGKSAGILIEFLLFNAQEENWYITIIDSDQDLILSKLGNSVHGEGHAFDVTVDNLRKKYIQKADIVLSLMPPALHFLIAKDCVELGKNLLTASYVDQHMRSLQSRIEEKNLLFLCEIGLDPGIDHMTAKKMIDDIHRHRGHITSFYSHCGGLVAPESDDNPWHYKISWNPANVVNAGKNGAIFKKEKEITELEYRQLFAEKRFVAVPGFQPLCWYPNRDSLTYIQLYGLEHCDTFIRTTLRHPDFIYGWKNIIELQLSDDVKKVQTDNLTLAAFFKKHMDDHGFSTWLEQRLQQHFNATKGLLEELVNLVEMEQKATNKGLKPSEEFMMVDDNGDLKEIDIDDLKINAAASLADKMHDASLTLKQLFYLGMNDDATIINKGICSTAEILRFALEKKLALQPHDKDMVIMLHEIEYVQEGRLYKTSGTLIIKGEDEAHTAMAKTVGLPMGIAAKLILNGTINERGLQIPVLSEIYEPVLKELARHGIEMKEQTTPL